MAQPVDSWSAGRCIVVLRGQELDITDYLDLHPGGATILRRLQGRDITRLFDGRLHSAKAWDIAQRYATRLKTLQNNPNDVTVTNAITVVEPSVATAVATSAAAHHDAAPQPACVASDDLNSEGSAAAVDIAEKIRRDVLKGTKPLDRRTSAAIRWHQLRRGRIQAQHPEKVAQLLRDCAYFPLTSAIGIAGAWVHWRVLTVWVPALLQWWLLERRSGSDDSGLAASCAAALFSAMHVFVFGLPQQKPNHSSALPAPPQDSFSSVAAAVLALFACALPLAYTVGACCKMVAFAASHEVAHETIHPLLCDGASGRSVPKALLLHAINLPSFGTTLYEYYHNQHLAHHRFLGGLSIEESIQGFFDGTQGGDGDQLSVNTLLMRQRAVSRLLGVPIDQLPPSERALAFVSISLPDVAKAMDGEFPKATLLRWVDACPVLTKLLYDPAIHVWYQGLTLATSFLYLSALGGYVFLLVLEVPLQLLLRCRLWPMTALLRYVRRKMAQDYGTSLSKDSLSLLRGMISVYRDIGMQNLLSLFVFGLAVWLSISTPIFQQYPIVLVLAMFLYLVLSEMFLFGFLFHPFLAYFLAVHQSAKSDGPAVASEPSDSASTPGSDALSCQPTRSIYNSWLSVAAFNLTYHVEHHDFPCVAWFYLPRVRAAFPEFYEEAANKAFRHGVWDVIWKYLKSRDPFVYACADMP